MILGYRWLTVWLLVIGVCLVVFYAGQSGPSMKLLAWDGTEAVVEEDAKPNAVIVLLVAPSRITRRLSTSERYLRITYTETAHWDRGHGGA